MSQSATQQSLWIETGYQHFAENGPSELKIKNIAGDAGISRTTFYHFFTDMADFIDHLLDYHREIAKRYLADLKKCKHYNPDVFRVVEAYRTSIFFHRQLLLHKENPTFHLTYQLLNKASNEIMYPLWAEFFGYDGNSLVGKEIHLMLLDLWYLNLTPADFSFEDFLDHSLEIKRQIELFSRSHQIQALGKL
jgi:AcrR family transcriptional regulator